jgi:hypothetical protein
MLMRTRNTILAVFNKAEKYWKRAEVDLIVANPEAGHRSSTTELKYYGEQARLIKEKIGTKIVLNGAIQPFPTKLVNYTWMAYARLISGQPWSEIHHLFPSSIW